MPQSEGGSDRILTAVKVKSCTILLGLGERLGEGIPSG
jgi:hypothetical protein